MDSIRCPRCAKVIPGLSHFCRRCGYAIAVAAPAIPPRAPMFRPAVAAAVAASSYTQIKPERRLPAPAAKRPPGKSSGGVGIFAVLAIVFALFFFNSVAFHSKPMAPPFPTQLDRLRTVPMTSSPFSGAPWKTPQPPPPIFAPTTVQPARPWDPDLRIRNGYPYARPEDSKTDQRYRER